ncbi:hypothetical protein BGZ81_000486 [Podila clonocystis]|nr:hypothetical protein BGZ81_000486 [Podila clonocystis]
MISQLDQQSSVFVQQQQELRERRDHVARAVESLENHWLQSWADADRYRMQIMREKWSEEEEEEKEKKKEEEEEGVSVVLHSHDVGDAEKDDTDDMFVHPVVSDKQSSYPGLNPSQATLSLSVSPPSSADSNASRHSRDEHRFKADCERCILKDELLQKRSALQQIQGEIERLQQRLNSCASQVRMIQRTFVGPIEQHLAMDQSELGRIERVIVKSA